MKLCVLNEGAANQVRRDVRDNVDVNVRNEEYGVFKVFEKTGLDCLASAKSRPDVCS